MPRGFTETDVPNQSGKIALVTGANTGIGFHVARVLAERGARVLVGCRSKTKADAAIGQIKKKSPKADVSFLPLDLGDLGSIRAAADQVKQEPRLDLLINNAGIMFPPRELTKDGFESQFGVNHLGPFALTGLLIEKVMQTPGGRVISTSSIGHRRINKIIFDDINAEAKYDKYQRYYMSKLANLLFAYELDHRLAKTEADTLSVACHPGVADTELSRHLPRAFFLVAPLIRPFFNTSAMGAWPTLMAAADADIESGRYYGPSVRGETTGPAKRVSSTPASHDKQLAKKLWDVSIEMTGVDPGL